jgi:hypothetical protein
VLTQAAILVLGVTGIALSQHARTAKYGCLVSLLAQPFWLYAGYVSEQWGIVAATFAYAAAWCVGVYEHWIRSHARA